MKTQSNIKRVYPLIILLGLGVCLWGSKESIQAQSISSEASQSSSQSMPELTETTTAIQTATANFNLAKYIPYTHFFNYQYNGNGITGGVREVITEYPMDSNGRYQITILDSNQSATAYIYELRADGLYELACFENYSDVNDLRYAPEADDGSYSQLLPVSLSVGTVYQSGYQNDRQRTILDVNMQYTINQKSYTDVIKIEENSANGTFYYYFAPTIGLIAVEDINEQVLYALTETYGSVY